MGRPSFLVFALLALGGCSTDLSGLGDELVDSSSSDDTSSSGDDTAVDEDTAVVEDSGVDSTVDSAVDSSTVVDSVVDGTVDGPTDSAAPDVADSAVVDAAVDAADSAVTPDVAIDAAPDTVVVDSVTDTGPTLVSTPGKVECVAGLCGKKFCCGAPKLSGGYDWQCVDNCGFFGVGTLDYACDEKADCSGSQVCCVNLAPFTTTWVGSGCRSSCGSDPQLCLTNAECPTGKTCTPTAVPSSPFSYATCK